MTIGKVTNLVIAGDHCLILTWDDGFVATVDLAGVIAGRKGLSALKDPDVFRQALVSGDGWSVEWPEGVDFGAQQLRRWAGEQSGEAMAPEAFRDWLASHRFTLDGAAEALGLSRRTIAYYLSGEQAVPKTVLLATRGYDHRAAA